MDALDKAVLIFIGMVMLFIVALVKL